MVHQGEFGHMASLQGRKLVSSPCRTSLARSSWMQESRNGCGCCSSAQQIQHHLVLGDEPVDAWRVGTPQRRPCSKSAPKTRPGVVFPRPLSPGPAPLTSGAGGGRGSPAPLPHCIEGRPASRRLALHSRLSLAPPLVWTGSGRGPAAGRLRHRAARSTRASAPRSTSPACPISTGHQRPRSLHAGRLRVRASTLYLPSLEPTTTNSTST